METEYDCKETTYEIWSNGVDRFACRAETVDSMLRTVERPKGWFRVLILDAWKWADVKAIMDKLANVRIQKPKKP